MTKSTFVFSGPTITETEILNYLPNAKCLPPIKSGDIIRCLRLDPEIILIIDGFFECTPSIWTKEILIALEQGVTVIGCSSIGALRAAELDQYGMIGVGAIYEEIKAQPVYDDDELAVFHHNLERDFMPLSEAMVNIRATIENAYNQNIINKSFSNILIETAKNIHFKKRTLEHVVYQLETLRLIAQEEITAFQDWLLKKEYVDLKKSDAIQALLYISKQQYKNTKHSHSITDIKETKYIKSLKIDMNNKPSIVYKQCLPEPEKIALLSRLLGGCYLKIKSLAVLMEIACSIAPNHNLHGHDDLTCLEKITSMAQSPSCEDYENEVFLDLDNSLKQIESILNANFNHENTDETNDSIDMFIKNSKLFNSEIEPDEITNKSSMLVTKLSATIWAILYSYLTKKGLAPSKNEFDKFVLGFRSRLKLFTVTDIKSWMGKYDLNETSYKNMLKQLYYYHYFIERHNILNIESYQSSSNWWLLAALHISGYYQHIKHESTHKEEFIARLKSNLMSCNHEYLLKLDFFFGHTELQELPSKLN